MLLEPPGLPSLALLWRWEEILGFEYNGGSQALREG